MGLNLSRWVRDRKRDIEDVFSADTQRDQQKRLSAGQPRFYADQQRAAGNMRPATNPGAAFLGNTARLANTTRAGFSGLYGLGRVGASSVFGTDQDYLKELRGAEQNLEKDLSPTGGAFGVGTFFDTPEQAKNISAPDLTKKITAGGAGVFGEVFPVGKGLSVAKQGVRVVPKIAKQGAAVAAVGNAGDQFIRTGKIDPKEVAVSSAFGLGASVLPPVAWAGAKKGAKPVINLAKGGSSKPKVTPKNTIVDDLVEAQKTQESNILKPTGVEEARAKGRRISSKVYNPYSEAERFNKAVVDSKGISLKKLDATQDLAHNLDAVANSEEAATKAARDSGLEEVVGRYKPGTIDESQFITYMAAKRDLDVRAKKKKQILPHTDEEVDAFVKQYEASNPRALDDLATVEKHFEGLAKSSVKSGTITPEAFQSARSTEDFYAPIARVIGSEDVLRPTVNANPLGSLSKQTTLQKLSGSNKPINVTWDAIVSANSKIIKENAKNKTFNIMYDAADKKLADYMVRMGMNKEQSKALFDLRDIIGQLEETGKVVNRERKVASRQARVASKKATAFNNKQQDLAIKRIASSMDEFDPDGAAALRGLGRREQSKILTWLSEGMTESKILKGNKLNKEAQDAYASLMALRAEAENLYGAKQVVKGEARGLQIIKDEKTGRQVLNGFVDGYPVWLEATPDMAKMIQGLEPKELGVFVKGLTNVQRVWRTFWTGIFNPVFFVKSKLFYDPAMMVMNQSGARNQLRPKAWGGALGDNFIDVGDFFDELIPYGAKPVTGSRIMGDVKQTAKLMASHADFESRVGYLAKHPTEALEALDILSGKLAHSSRMQAARAEYLKAKAANLSEEVAKSNAARAYNNVLPNYGRTTKTLRIIDAFIPYTNAGIAGTRAMTGAARTDPAGWATKATVFASALAAAGAYALTDDKTKEFYQDMYDKGYVSVLQNNIVMALPGAKKNPETGEWEGIIKVPIPPEFRAPNALIQDRLFKQSGGEANGYNPTVGAVSTLATSGVLNIGRGGGANAELNPGLAAATELTTNKRDMGTGEPYAYGDTQFLPRNEQINNDTSQLAVVGAQAFNKLPVGDISPAALDSQFKSFGPGGKIIRSIGSTLASNATTPEERLPGTDIVKTIKSMVVADGTKGMTEATWHFKNQDKIRESLKTKTYRDQFDILNSKSDSPGDAGQKAGLLFESLQTDGVLWEAQKKQDELDSKYSKLSNPLYQLSPEQARAVTLYRSNARMNAAKQTYAKDGSSLFQSLNLDEPWYQEFREKESAFYDKIAAKKGDKETDTNMSTAGKTYSGKGYKEPSPVIQSKLNTYYKLPKGTGARTAFLAANPDIIQYWDEQNNLANEERIAMGLNRLDDYKDQYGGGYGSGKNGGGSKKYDPTTNPYKYAVNLSLGDTNLRPKVSVKAVAKSKNKPVVKPKVSLKKSKV